jgi:hypothetical protein
MTDAVRKKLSSSRSVKSLKTSLRNVAVSAAAGGRGGYTFVSYNRLYDAPVTLYSDDSDDDDSNTEVALSSERGASVPLFVGGRSANGLGSRGSDRGYRGEPLLHRR